MLHQKKTNYYIDFRESLTQALTENRVRNLCKTIKSCCHGLNKQAIFVLRESDKQLHNILTEVFFI